MQSIERQEQSQTAAHDCRIHNLPKRHALRSLEMIPNNKPNKTTTMSILNKIKSGRIGRSQKVVIYAPEGFGKSTLASQFPNPLFLDVEDSTAQMDVARIGAADLPDLAAFESALAEIVKAKPCQTLVVDTIDWLEEMAVKAVIEADDKKYGAKNIEEVGGGFGKGYNFLTSRMNVVLSKLDRVIDAGIHVVLLAHASVVRFDPPDGVGAYDRYELKLFKDRKGGKGTASLVKEWADLVIFGNWRTQIAEKGKGDNATYKGVGGRERLMNCNRCSAWDAKNRHGMKDVEKWDISVMAEAFKRVGAAWGDTPAAPVTINAEALKTEPVATPEPQPVGAAQAPVTVKEDTIPGTAVDPELERIVKPHAEAVTAYLVKAGKIGAGQGWSDMPKDFADRIKRNPARFLEVVGVKGKEAA